MKPSRPLPSPAVKKIEIAEFCESLASMLGSGLPLLESMESIKETIRVKRLRDAIDEVIGVIAQGESLSGAFSRRPEVFPEMLIFFCHIGEETGTIQTALDNTANYLKKVDSIVSQVKRALIYPGFVVAAMLCVIIFWLFFVLPRLVSTFKEINVQLPNITLSLVNFVQFSKDNWLIYPIAIGLITIGFVILGKIPKNTIDAEPYCLQSSRGGRSAEMLHPYPGILEYVPHASVRRDTYKSA